MVVFISTLLCNESACWLSSSVHVTDIEVGENGRRLRIHRGQVEVTIDF